MRRLLIACLLAAAALPHAARAQNYATLYFTHAGGDNRAAGPSRPAISFRTGEVGSEELGEKRDLAFGLLKINNEDWFEVVSVKESGRTVIRDLGPQAWSDDIAVPALTPLPELKPGESRTTGVDASADTHAKWAKTNGVFAKVLVGHLYAVRVVQEGADFYVLFRVEAHEQDKSCAITWKVVPAPAEASATLPR